MTARFIRSLRRERCFVWNPGVSTNTNWPSGRGHDPGHAMARRLRLFRRDADAFADQPVEQRRLADVRAAGDRHVAAAKVRGRGDVSHRARRRRCAAARVERLRGGGLLRGAAIRAGAAWRRSPARGSRHSIVNVCACASPSIADHRVLRHGDAARLQPLLQPRLRILAERRRIEVGELRRVDALDHAARGVEAGVDEHRAEHRLERIGEDRRPLAAAALQLAFAEARSRRRGRARARGAPACRD